MTKPVSFIISLMHDKCLGKRRTLCREGRIWYFCILFGRPMCSNILIFNLDKSSTDNKTQTVIFPAFTNDMTMLA